MDLATRTLLVLYYLVLAVSSLPTQNTNSEHKDDIMLNVEELSKLGDMDKIFDIIRRMAGALHGCGVKEVPNLRRVNVKNRTVTCNDGSPAGYYIRKSFGSSRWIIHLEGGWYCFDADSCSSRWVNMRSHMSSRMWPDSRKGTGILSWDPEENPYFFNANVVFVPYCSSDSWSGTYKAKKESEFSFMGSLIVEEVVKDLIANQGMGKGKKLLLTGSSAGGLGVLMNLDKVSAQVKKLTPGMEVRGIADSGWFLDNTQYKQTECIDAHTCSPTEGIHKGLQMWEGDIPEDCRKHYPHEVWRCFFGYRLYPFIKAPVFIIQFLFDEAQISADNVGPPLKKEQWQYIHTMGKEIKKSLQNTSAVFASACLSHTILTKPEWHQVAIKGTTLIDALRCWIGSDYEPNNNPASIHSQPFGSMSKEDNLLGDDPSSTRKKNKNRKRKGNKRRKNKGSKKRRKERKGRKKNRQDSTSSRPQRNELARRERSANKDITDPRIEQHRLMHHAKCKHHLIDMCAWPQCNLSCPKLRHPFTGEEIDFIDLLMQFGLDLSSIANALGMDLKTLQTMDHDQLLQKLTEQE